MKGYASSVCILMYTEGACTLRPKGKRQYKSWTGRSTTDSSGYKNFDGHFIAEFSLVGPDG
jgi:hypothetical protein